MPPPLLFELASFALGLLLGSFLNVCISRLPHHKSVVQPHSHCPHCLARIRPYDNIPLLSWILLRARCRDCKHLIAWRYPAVELAVGFWFLYIADQASVVWNANQPDVLALMHAMGTAPYSLVHQVPLLLSLAILGFLLIGLIVMDWQTHRLPDAFTLTGIALGLFLVCVRAAFLGPTEDQIILTSAHQLRLSSPGSMADQGNIFLTGPEHLILGRVLAVAAVAALLLTIRAVYKALRHRTGLGLGDVKMLAMVAAFLGFWPAILTLFLGTLLATLYALPLVLRHKANALTRLPFGSFLGLAGLVAALFAQPLISWYTTLLR